MAFDLYAAIARLERTSGVRLGESGPLAREPVRFVPDSSLGFPARELHASSDGREWTTSFLGLSGACGSLPSWLLDEMAEEEPERAGRTAFLGPFHHRAVSLLHRSVHRCRVPDATSGWRDAWPLRLARLTGVACDDDRDVPLALAIAPLLFGSRSARSFAAALRLVADRWLEGAPIALVEGTAGRIAVPAEGRSRLGATSLGDTALLGGAVLDPDQRASIVVGPIDARLARRLAPDADGHHMLARLACWFGGAYAEVDLEIHRDPDSAAALGRAALGASALGRARTGRRERRALHATPRVEPR